MKIGLWLLILSCIMGRVDALLSPFYQSIEEIDTILHHPDLPQYFQQGEGIENIQRLHAGYLLTSRSQEVMAGIVYTPNDLFGKQSFKVVFCPPNLERKKTDPPATSHP